MTRITADEYKIISGYRLRISEAWEASSICEFEIKFPRYQFFIIQFWLLHYSIELCYKALLLSRGVKKYGHVLADLHKELMRVMPDAIQRIDVDSIKELGKYGDAKGGIRYPEDFPSKWEHTRTIWEKLEPFKNYALEQTYKHGSEYN